MSASGSCISMQELDGGNSCNVEEELREVDRRKTSDSRSFCFFEAGFEAGYDIMKKLRKQE